MEFKKSNTIYMQIADHICENVLQEIWKKGERISSVRELAAAMQVNPNTVMRTYSMLQDLDIIFNKRGIGYFVSEKADAHAQKWKKSKFMEETLPELFQNMEILEISLKDLKEYYEQFKKQNHENHN